MKNLKKILAVIVTIIISISVTSNIISAETDSIEDMQFNELNRYGIINGYDDGELHPERFVTRAEIAQIMLNISDSYYHFHESFKVKDVSALEQFSDVPQDHWASDTIAIAKEYQLVNGYPDGTYHPDDNVTYAEIIKLLVAYLDYDIFRFDYPDGGYPDLYLEKAAEIGITDELSFNPNDKALRGDIAAMIYNMIDIPFLESVYSPLSTPKFWYEPSYWTVRKYFEAIIEGYTDAELYREANPDTI